MHLTLFCVEVYICYKFRRGWLLAVLCWCSECVCFSASLFRSKAECVRAVKTLAANEPHAASLNASCTEDDSTVQKANFGV